MTVCAHCGQSAPVSFGGYRFDAEQGVLISPEGDTRRISRAEGKVFGVLFENGAKGRIATKEAIFDALYWDRGENAEPELKIIDVFVCKLRKRLPPGLAIETNWGRGYKLVTREAVG